MNVVTNPKNNLFNIFQRFVKSKYHVTKIYCKNSKGKDENEGENSKFNLTTGAVRDKDSAKEDSFFYKQSLEQLKALKDRFFKDKSTSEEDEKKKN